MRFEAPLFLLLLLAVPALWAVWVAWRRRVAERMARLSRQAVAAPARSGVQTGLLLGALAALCVALAGPRWGRGTEESVARGRNLMLAVDVSRSMLAEDVRPNRLGRAKADLIDLVDALRGDRAGLLAFRGKGVLLCPMTSDAAFLRQSIDALAPDSAPWPVGMVAPCAEPMPTAKMGMPRLPASLAKASARPARSSPSEMRTMAL